MTFAIVGGGQLDTGYTIDNSLRFNSGDSAYLNQTLGTPTTRRRWTMSMWVKRAKISYNYSVLFSTANLICRFGSGDTLQLYDFDGNFDINLTTTQVFRDTSAWYHLVFIMDIDGESGNDRLKLYSNNVRVSWSGTDPASYDPRWNYAAVHYIGRENTTSNYFDGYMAEVNFIDGQALDPTDFGEFDEDSGIWKPIQYTGTYGNNGFYLDYEDSAALGDDVSGNGNDFTPNNLASTDQTTDTPTNNFATMSSIDTNGNASLSEGNTQLQRGTNYAGCNGTFGLSSGKWYWEVKTPTPTTSGENESFGVSKVPHATIGNNYLGLNTNSWAIMIDNAASDIYKNHNNSFTDTGINASANDIFNIALDMDNNKVYFGRNGTYFDSGDPAAGTNPTYSSVSGDPHIYPAFSMNGDDTIQVNFGNAPFSISSGNTDDNGYGNFEYAPPTGFLALCTQNLATELSPTIDDGSEYFNTVLYTGTGTTQSITGVGFQPDWVWLKDRDFTYDHQLHDSSRGASAGYLASNNTNSENPTYPLSSFDSDGWTTVSSGTPGQNASGDGFVSWNWLVNGGSTSSNTDGSITSTVQANTTAGFSIVTYTGTGSNATIGHGLGVKPDMVIVKNRSAGARGWVVWHNALAGNEALELNTTDAKITSATSWNSTVPTSSVFSVGTRVGTNESSQTFVAYCFADIEGYSKFGSYTGNGSTDGTFVYTGFRPAWIMIKRADSGGSNWIVIDTTRFTYNQISYYLRASTSDAETDQFNIDEDIVSNGFKLRGDSGNINASGGTYIYMAFAENPFVSSAGVPVVAR